MSRKKTKVATLENILRKYFDFQDSTQMSESKSSGNMISQRNEAYDRMINFLCDLSEMGVNGIDEGLLIDELNEIMDKF